MAPKRKYQEAETQEIVHESRQFQVPGSAPKPAAKKPRRTEPYEFKKQAHTSSVNSVKKRIRDITRRLERSEDLPADVRVQDERALATYQQELAAAEAEKLRQKMIKKYHMVRFFERQKATRQLKKLKKRLLETESTEELEELKVQMHIAEVDLNYTQYCPLVETYVSLYPQKKGDGEEDDAKGQEPPSKPAMWAEVEKAMEKGTLQRLRNRVINVPSQPPRVLQIKPAKKKQMPAAADTSGMNRRERRAQAGIRGVKEPVKVKNKSIGFERNQVFGAMEGAKISKREAEGEESDGGFFEE